MDAARRAGNAEPVRELEAIAPYAAPGQTIPICMSSANGWASTTCDEEKGLRVLPDDILLSYAPRPLKILCAQLTDFLE
jgi:hypothetical protein